jgi:hypothetical protein
MKKAVYYCVGGDAQRGWLDGLDRGLYAMEVVDLGKLPSRIGEAEDAGVKTLPAMVADGKVFHAADGTPLEDLKHAQLDEEPQWPQGEESIHAIAQECDCY